jgi:hypothetical protein
LGKRPKGQVELQIEDEEVYRYVPDTQLRQLEVEPEQERQLLVHPLQILFRPTYPRGQLSLQV